MSFLIWDRGLILALHIEQLLCDTLRAGGHHVYVRATFHIVCQILVILILLTRNAAPVSVVNYSCPLDLDHVLRLFGTLWESGRCNVSDNLRSSYTRSDLLITTQSTISVMFRALTGMMGFGCDGWTRHIGGSQHRVDYPNTRLVINATVDQWGWYSRRLLLCNLVWLFLLFPLVVLLSLRLQCHASWLLWIIDNTWFPLAWDLLL